MKNFQSLLEYIQDVKGDRDYKNCKNIEDMFDVIFFKNEIDYQSEHKEKYYYDNNINKWLVTYYIEIGHKQKELIKMIAEISVNQKDYNVENEEYNEINFRTIGWED